jgi:hypothetical protein
MANLALVHCQKLSEAEQFALTRDALARGNPDELLNGFFPAWAVLLFLLSGKILQ